MSEQDQKMQIGISRLAAGVELPAYQTPGSAGMDVRAYLPEGDVKIAPGERLMVPTGFKLEIPTGFEIQVRPRSGLAIKHGITLINTPGTIDSDFRGEVNILVVNLGQEGFTIENGMRIAQLVVGRVIQTQWLEKDELAGTERNEGGFGHTGVN